MIMIKTSFFLLLLLLLVNPGRGWSQQISSSSDEVLTLEQAPVPEPSSATLLGVDALVVSFIRLRRRCISGA